jgi:hypothetical protein
MVDGNDENHIEENKTWQVEKWISKMTNGHLTLKLGWVAYRFKLWPGVCYGLATLAMPLKIAACCLSQENFRTLSCLGVNRNVKREWWTIHRAFGGMGLFSIAVEHTFAMINIFIQHYGAGITLARKFLASMEALQLESGCVGNLLRRTMTTFMSWPRPAG